MFIKHKQNEKFNEISREKMLLASGNLVTCMLHGLHVTQG